MNNPKAAFTNLHKTMAINNSNLALLIDGDNVSSKVVVGLMAEIANYGTASVRRIYGDWTRPELKGWKACLLPFSISPMQQFAYTTGKNATDGAMIIDAMDLLYTGRFSSFCIVSSDSDFTRLAARIREQGVTVYGFGERKTVKAFIAACDKFMYFDALSVEAEEDVLNTEMEEPQTALQLLSSYVPPVVEPSKMPLDQAAYTGIRRAVKQLGQSSRRGAISKNVITRFACRKLRLLEAQRICRGFGYC